MAFKQAHCKRGHDMDIHRRLRGVNQTPACNACQNLRTRKWYNENKDQAIKGVIKSRLRTLFGMSLNDVEIMLTAQCGQCLLCERAITMKTKCIDHDHESGQVRGLLCTQCNTALGMVKDNPETLQRMITYVTKSKLRLVV